MVKLEVLASPASLSIDGVEVASAENGIELLKPGFTIVEGDAIEIDDPAVAQGFCHTLAMDAALTERLENAQSDWEGEADQVINVDLGVTLNGTPLLGVSGPFIAGPVTDPVEPICHVGLYGGLYGAWTTVLLLGGDLAVFSYRAEEGDLEWDAQSGVSTVGDALGLLTDRANDERYVPDCPRCAMDYDGQSWGIDIYSYVDLSDELKVQMLNALWAPCDEHPSAALDEFDARWTWSGKGWVSLV